MGAMPPLHVRCIGVMHMALALGLWSAQRRLDAAAARLPLLLISIWGAAAVAAALLANRAATGQAWLACMAVAGAGAACLLARNDDMAAPAERQNRAWAGLALGAGTLGVALLLAPAMAAALWPWHMAAAQAAAYAAPLLGFGAMAWAAARERRRYVREPALLAWLAMVLGLLAVSLRHAGLFAVARPATWVWFGTLVTVLIWATAQQGWFARAWRGQSTWLP